MAGGHPRRIFAGVFLSVLALLALGILLMVWERQRATRIARVPATPQVVATPAHTGDIGVYLSGYVGTVETSNSVVFSISQDEVQEVVHKFDAGESLVVKAYNARTRPQCNQTEDWEWASGPKARHVIARAEAKRRPG